MLRSHRNLCAVCSALTLAFWAVPQVYAQNLFVTSNRTIAGGNPINGSYNQITIGFDGIGTGFPGVRADVTGGSAVAYINATFQSLVNISGGAFGTAPTGSTYASALAVQGGSTVNLSGGTFNSFGFVGPLGGSTSLTSTLNFSGGTITDVFVYNNAVVNMTGGIITALPGNTATRGELSNSVDGTVNFSGGSVDRLRMRGFNNVNYASSNYCTTNISGGTIGSIIAGGDGFLNFLGSGLIVTAGGEYVLYDPSFIATSFVRDYTVTGTLSSGEVLHQTFTAADSYSATSTQLNFRGSGTHQAKNLYVETNQTLNTVSNFVTVGYDETFSTPSSPSVTVVSGAQAAFMDVYNDSIVQMTGGVVHSYLQAGGASQVTVTGGRIGNSVDPFTGITAYENSTVSVLGGIINRVQALDNSQVTIGGAGRRCGCGEH